MPTWSDIRARAAQPPTLLARIQPELARTNAERRAQRAAGIQAHTYPSSSGSYGSQLYEWLVGDAQRSAAGVVVNERTIMCVGAVYAAVSLIAGAIASLPLPIYQRTPAGRDRVDVQSNTMAANLWWLLNEQPHRRLSAAVFWEYLVASLLLHGDAFARIERRGSDVAGMIPVHPQCVQVKEDADRQGLVYVVEGEPTAIPQDDMLHIPGIGFDGLRGLSPLRSAAKSAVGIALAADEYQARFFGNGARPDFALTSPGKLDEAQIAILRDTWQQRFGGAAKSHLPAILTGGLDVKPLNLSHEDMQIIATRQFQVVDIARIFGVPPHMIGETENTSSWGAGIEAMGIGFVRYTLQRHLVKIEQEINRKVFKRSLRWFAEFDVNGLERGDYKSRNEGYRTALGRAGEQGWMTANEIRRRENLPPIEGGDALNQGDPDAPATEAADQ